MRYLYIYFKVFVFISTYYFFFKDFIYLFLEKEGGRRKERERNINAWLPLTRPLLGTWPETQACALTENRTREPLVCRLALNPLSHICQGWGLCFEEDGVQGSPPASRCHAQVQTRSLQSLQPPLCPQGLWPPFVKVKPPTA